MEGDATEAGFRTVYQGGPEQQRHWLQPKSLSGSSRNDLLEWVRPLVANRSVLDVGCATGHWRADWVHGHIADVASECVGIDVDTDLVAAVRAKGFEIVAADVEHLDLGRTFDVIFGGEVIEHLANPGLFLDTVVKHLAPGGSLVMTTPNAWGVAGLAYQFIPGHVRFNEDHVAWYDEATMRQLLRRYGFESEIGYLRHQTPGRFRRAVMSALRRPLPDRLAWGTMTVVARLV